MLAADPRVEFPRRAWPPGRSARVCVAILAACLLACGGRVKVDPEGTRSASTQDASTRTVDAGSEGESGDATASDSYRPSPEDSAAPADASDGGDDSDDSGDDGARPDGADAPACDSGQPVEVCVQYYDYLSTCFGRDFRDLACQASLIPDGAADLAYIQMLCAANLQRIEQACH